MLLGLRPIMPVQPARAGVPRIRPWVRVWFEVPAVAELPFEAVPDLGQIPARCAIDMQVGRIDGNITPNEAVAVVKPRVERVASGEAIQPGSESAVGDAERKLVNQLKVAVV